MKNCIYALAAIMLASCGSKPVMTVSENPWPDKYAHDEKILTTPSEWGVYNVHDPSVRKVGDYYYMYSTDVVYVPREKRMTLEMPKMGYLQMRRSRDLVNWDFVGWAFDSIPAEGAEWVASVNDGRGPVNIWAPYMVEATDGNYRMYYCVSAFGKKASAICLAKAPSPEGPWEHKGCVVQTSDSTAMNAIDPSVVTDAEGRQWMHYGSYFGGIYCVELDPATGFTLVDDDHGHLVARRANYKKDNLEAPEVIYVPEQGQYYFFGSYDPLMTSYNVRVGRSNDAQGPYIDFFGKELADTTNNFPILVSPYRFEGHEGWAGTGHCGVFGDGKGNYYMAHQGRLSPDNQQLNLHLRQMFFTVDGWPVVSPERYAGVAGRKYDEDDLIGKWEIIRVLEPATERRLEAGQVLWGEGGLFDGESNESMQWEVLPGADDWAFDTRTQLLTISLDGEEIDNLIVHAGHDWERGTDTVLFTGLDADGRSVWGKRIE